MVQVPNPRPWRFAQPPSSHSSTLGLSQIIGSLGERLDGRTTKIQHIRHRLLCCSCCLRHPPPPPTPSRRSGRTPIPHIVSSSSVSRACGSGRWRLGVPLSLESYLFIQPPDLKSASLVCAATATRDAPTMYLSRTHVSGRAQSPLFVPCRIECASPPHFGRRDMPPAPCLAPVAGGQGGAGLVIREGSIIECPSVAPHSNTPPRGPPSASWRFGSLEPPTLRYRSISLPLTLPLPPLPAGPYASHSLVSLASPALK